MIKSAVNCLTILLLLLAHTTAASAKEMAPREVPIYNQAIQIDGVLSEPAWQKALIIDLNYETEPGENVMASFETQAYLIHSESELYVAFNAKGDPEDIRAHFRNRDNIGGDDQVGVVIDPFADHSRAYMFFMSPEGAVYDALYHELSGNEESGWDGQWESKATITDTGFQAEFVIPFNIMTLPATQQVNMAIDLVRVIPREQRHRISYVSLQRGNNCYLCQLNMFSLRPSMQSRAKTKVNISETVSFERARFNQGNWQDDGEEFEHGFELSHQTKQNALFSMAINPDFSQVALDDLILDLNQQFSLFVPENRSYFLENADFFRSNFSLIYTKNISEPEYTAKYTEKGQNNEKIFLYAKDSELRLLLPDANFSQVFASDEIEGHNIAGRYRKSLNHKFSLGATGTARDYTDYKNHTGSIDLKWTPNPHSQLDLQWAGSSTESDISGLQEGNGNKFGSAYYVNYIYSKPTWNVNLYTGGSTDQFRADLGFIPQNDFKDGSILFSFLNYLTSSSYFEKIEFSTELYEQTTWTGQDLSNSYSQKVALIGKDNFELAGEVGTKTQRFIGQTFRQPYRNIEFTYSPTDASKISTSIYQGDRIDFVNGRLGETLEWNGGLNWRINNDIELKSTLTYWDFDSAGEDLFELYGASLSGLYFFSNNAFLRLSLQKRETRRNVGNYLFPGDWSEEESSLDWQLLYHLSYKKRFKFYAGYTTYDLSSEDVLNFNEERQYAFAKFSYHFDL